MIASLKLGRNPMSAIDDEIRGIDAWLKATGMSESRLGLLAAANPRAIERIRSGAATIETLRKVLHYITDHPAETKKKRR